MKEQPATTDRDQSILWARDMLTKEFVVLDTETTGLDDDAEAVQIGIVGKDGAVLLDTLLRHETPSNPKAEAAHGIAWEMTRNAPRFREVFPRLVELTQDKILIGYNVSFDTRIIEQTMARYEIDYLPIFRADASDVMPQFAQFYGDFNDYYGNYRWQKLTTAAACFGLDTQAAHSAAADALITLRVVQAMATSKLSTEEYPQATASE